jgi:amidophosphoribosyltransferase
VLGELDGCPILTSETCALDIIGAKFVREIENGEVVVFISEQGIESHKPFPPWPSGPASSNTSISPGRIRSSGPPSMSAARHGRSLRCEAPTEADVVVPVPDSGVPAALGYAQASGIPFELGIIRNHYVGRTFIEPTQKVRELGVKLKHSANARGRGQAHRAGRRFDRARHDLAEDRQDDARCRRPRGAFPHRLAADHPSRLLRHRHARPDKLLAATHSLEEMRQFVGADSLAFISVDGLYKAMGHEAVIRPGRNSPTIASPATIRLR